MEMGAFHGRYVMPTLGSEAWLMLQGPGFPGTLLFKLLWMNVPFLCMSVCHLGLIQLDDMTMLIPLTELTAQLKSRVLPPCDKSVTPSTVTKDKSVVL